MRQHASICRCALVSMRGDLGDVTSAASREEARQRHAHVNKGHVPDLYRLGVVPWVWEYK